MQIPKLSQPRTETNIFAEYHNSTAFSDVVISNAGRTKLHAHKVVLAAHSEPIKAMLQVMIQTSGIPNHALSSYFGTVTIRLLGNDSCNIAPITHADMYHYNEIVQEQHIWLHTVMCSAVFLLQSGMQESAAREITLQDIKGSTLQSLVSYMYGGLSTIPSNVVLPLFVAADKYQVSCQGCYLKRCSV